MLKSSLFIGWRHWPIKYQFQTSTGRGPRKGTVFDGHHIENLFRLLTIVHNNAHKRASDWPRPSTNEHHFENLFRLLTIVQNNAHKRASDWLRPLTNEHHFENPLKTGRKVKLTLIISFSLNLFLLVGFLNLVGSIQILTVTQSSFDFFSC